MQHGGSQPSSQQLATGHILSQINPIYTISIHKFSIKVLFGKPKGKKPLGRQRRGRMGSEWNLGWLSGWEWIGFDWLGIGTGVELL
jgi:hypothetical protein